MKIVNFRSKPLVVLLFVMFASNAYSYDDIYCGGGKYKLKIAGYPQSQPSTSVSDIMSIGLSDGRFYEEGGVIYLFLVKHKEKLEEAVKELNFQADEMRLKIEYEKYKVSFEQTSDESSSGDDKTEFNGKMKIVLLEKGEKKKVLYKGKVTCSNYET